MLSVTSTTKPAACQHQANPRGTSHGVPLFPLLCPRLDPAPENQMSSLLAGLGTPPSQLQLCSTLRLCFTTPGQCPPTSHRRTPAQQWCGVSTINFLRPDSPKWPSPVAELMRDPTITLQVSPPNPRYFRKIYPT